LAIRHEPLDDYLIALSFRFNRPKSASHRKLFHRLVEQAVTIEPAAFASLRRTTIG